VTAGRRSSCRPDQARIVAAGQCTAKVALALVRWDDPAQGLVKLRRGRLGETTTRDGGFEAELRGLGDALKQEFGQVYGPTCRADLGDARCGIDLALHVQTAAITAVLGQDSFTLTPALATTKPIPGGKVVWTSGANAGIALEIRGYDGGTQTVELFVPPPLAPDRREALMAYVARRKEEIASEGLR
jgi:uncharacterized phage protein (TIGR02218 family)